MQTLNVRLLNTQVSHPVQFEWGRNGIVLKAGDEYVEIDIQDLYDKLRALFGVESKFDFIPLENGDVKVEDVSVDVKAFRNSQKTGV